MTKTMANNLFDANEKNKVIRESREWLRKVTTDKYKFLPLKSYVQ